jgi:hypothetical protein
LPGEWGDAVDVVDVDSESGLVVTTKSGAPGYDLCRDDIWVSLVL